MSHCGYRLIPRVQGPLCDGPCAEPTKTFPDLISQFPDCNAGQRALTEGRAPVWRHQGHLGPDAQTQAAPAAFYSFGSGIRVHRCCPSVPFLHASGSLKLQTLSWKRTGRGPWAAAEMRLCFPICKMGSSECPPREACLWHRLIP